MRHCLIFKCLSLKIEQYDSDETSDIASKNDLNYTYCQLKLSPKAAKRSVFAIVGGDLKGYYQSEQALHGYAV